MSDTSTFESVKSIVIRTLQIQGRAHMLNPSTPLFGSMPELDSLAVVELAASLEDQFGFEIDDDDFTDEIFESLGTLTEYVDRRRAAQESVTSR